VAENLRTGHSPSRGGWSKGATRSRLGTRSSAPTPFPCAAPTTSCRPRRRRTSRAGFRGRRRVR